MACNSADWVRARRRDLVSHQKLGENRPLDKAESAPPIGSLVQHFRSQNIGGHQVRRELDAAIVEAQHGGERIDQHGLAQTRLPHQKRVATRKDRRKDLLDHLVLADETPLDAGSRLDKAASKRQDLINQFVILGHDNSSCCSRNMKPRIGRR